MKLLIVLEYVVVPSRCDIDDDAAILNLIEKTVFVNGFPDAQYKTMKSVVAFNKTITLDQIYLKR